MLSNSAPTCFSLNLPHTSVSSERHKNFDTQIYSFYSYVSRRKACKLGDNKRQQVNKMCGYKAWAVLNYFHCSWEFQDTRRSIPPLLLCPFSFKTKNSIPYCKDSFLLGYMWYTRLSRVNPSITCLGHWNLAGKYHLRTSLYYLAMYSFPPVIYKR